MTRRLEGQIRELIPYFCGEIDPNGHLVIAEQGPIRLTVDTGFSGTIALPNDILDKIKLELIDYGVFRLATGDEVELPLYWGEVVIGSKSLETWFIPGDCLLGMELLTLAGRLLALDFQKQKVVLT